MLKSPYMMIRVGFIQNKPLFGEVRRNVERVVERLLRVDADIVVLPELFATGYQFRTRKELLKYSEGIPEGYTSRALLEVAGKKGCFIVAGIPERAGGRVYNSCALFGPAGMVGLYRKAHLFWREKRLFSPGDTPFRVYDAGGVRVGMMICFDWLFPEVARTLTMKGADVICHPSNLVLPYCPQAMVTRCIENRVFGVTANRVGTEERIRRSPLRFIGKSQIVSPEGRILCRASGNREETGVFDIDIRMARKKKITPENHVLHDLRRDLL